jgi:hypothetical protein
MAYYIGPQGEVKAVQLTEQVQGNGFVGKPGEWRVEFPDGKAYYCDNGSFMAQFSQKYPRAAGYESESCQQKPSAS